MRAHATSVHDVLSWVKLILHKYLQVDLATLIVAGLVVVQHNSRETASSIKNDCVKTQELVAKVTDLPIYENH